MPYQRVYPIETALFPWRVFLLQGRGRASSVAQGGVKEGHKSAACFQCARIRVQGEHGRGIILDKPFLEWIPYIPSVPQNEVGSIEASTDTVRERFSDLEARMAHVSQVGTRIGDRLQVRGSEERRMYG